MAEELASKPWRDPESIPNQPGFKLVALVGSDNMEIECVVDWRSTPEGHFLRSMHTGIPFPVATVKGWLPVNDPWVDHETRLQNCGQHIHGLMQRVEALEARVAGPQKISSAVPELDGTHVCTGKCYRAFELARAAEAERLASPAPTPAPTAEAAPPREVVGYRVRWALPLPVTYAAHGPGIGGWEAVERAAPMPRKDALALLKKCRTWENRRAGDVFRLVRVTRPVRPDVSAAIAACEAVVALLDTPFRRADADAAIQRTKAALAALRGQR